MDCSINHIGEIAYLFKKKKPPQENLGEYFYNCRITKTFWSKTYKQSHKENIYKFDKIKVFYMANQQTHAIKKKNPKGKYLYYNGLRFVIWKKKGLLKQWKE